MGRGPAALQTLDQLSAETAARGALLARAEQAAAAQPNSTRAFEVAHARLRLAQAAAAEEVAERNRDVMRHPAPLAPPNLHELARRRMGLKSTGGPHALTVPIKTATPAKTRRQSLEPAVPELDPEIAAKIERDSRLQHELQSCAKSKAKGVAAWISSVKGVAAMELNRQQENELYLERELCRLKELAEHEDNVLRQQQLDAKEQQRELSRQKSRAKELAEQKTAELDRLVKKALTEMRERVAQGTLLPGDGPNFDPMSQVSSIMAREQCEQG